MARKHQRGFRPGCEGLEGRQLLSAYFVNAYSGKVLDDPGFSTSNQTRIQQYQFNGGTNQQWDVIPLSNGKYEIANKYSGKALEDPGFSTSNQTPIQQNQWNGGANQQWNLIRLSNGNYEIANAYSGKVLDDPGFSTSNQTIIDQNQWNGNGATNEQWRLVQPVTTPGSVPFEPVTTVAGATYRSFAGDPLFASDGPSPDDVMQGQVGDCSFLATLVGIARDDPARICQSIVDLHDGTYSVTFPQGGNFQSIRVDAGLPVDSSGHLIYAQLGHQNSLWVALMEKAWTYARPTSASWFTSNFGTYNMIDWGSPGELLGLLGIKYQVDVTNTIGGKALWDNAIENVKSGKFVAVVTNGTVSATSGLVAAHCYFVDHINLTWVPPKVIVSPKLGPITIDGHYEVTSATLRNPWGGASEFVTISGGDFETNFSCAISAYV
jgi:hypothetical protein